jgi:L-fuconolactonase
MIDTHVHFWNYHPVKDAWISDNMEIIQCDFYPQDVIEIFNETGINGCVAVQADQSEKETEFLVSLASENPIIKGVVGWIDLRSDDIEERLAYFNQFAIIKGWRHIVQAEPSGFLNEDKFLNGIKAIAKYKYTYDVLITHRQLPEAIKFIEKFDQQPFIIDHCAKPDIKNMELENYRSQLHAIAQNKNVACKLSGLLTEADWLNWTEAQIFSYFDVVFEAFGTDRVLFGSDWPVVKLAGTYLSWMNLVLKYLEQFSAIERNKIMGENAVVFYNL